MLRNHDRHFLKNFTLIIVGLHVVAVVLIALAWFLHQRQPVEENATATAMTIPGRPSGTRAM